MTSDKHSFLKKSDNKYKGSAMNYLSQTKPFLRRVFGKRLLRFYRGWIKGFLIRPQKSFSQKGEDLIIQSFFGKRKKGYYLDIGCFHPKQISNTHLFDKNGWHGFAVDIDSYKTDLFKKTRMGRCKTMVAAVVGAAPKTKKAEVYRFGDKAGWSDIDTLDYDSAVWQRDIKKAGEFRTEIINVIGINELLAQLPSVNFLNIDVEGMDTEILQAINLADHDIDVILFEDNLNWGGSEKIKSKLKRNGYSLLFVTGGSVCFCKRK